MADKMITAFFSYAHIDWEAPSDKKVIDSVCDQLTGQARAELGHRDFDLWRDVDKLRWGERWSEELFDALAGCNPFIPLISRAWFNSKHCIEEYNAFKDAVDREGMGIAILPIIFRTVQEEHVPNHAKDIHASLRDWLFKDWSGLGDLSEAERNKEFRQAGRDLAARIDKLIPSEPSASAATPALPASRPLAFPAAPGIPVVSGSYDMPSQGGGAVLLKLTFAGLAEASTSLGSVVFAITQASITTTVSGGRIVDPDMRFGGAGCTGPVAHVWRSHSLNHVETLTMAARSGHLFGEPLVEPGEAGHIRLFDLEHEAEGACHVAGQVLLSHRAVQVIEHDPPADLTSEQDAAARQGMIGALAWLVVEKFGDSVVLEGFQADE
jgi:hypothetical protein